MKKEQCLGVGPQKVAKFKKAEDTSYLTLSCAKGDAILPLLV